LRKRRVGNDSKEKRHKKGKKEKERQG